MNETDYTELEILETLKQKHFSQCIVAETRDSFADGYLSALIDFNVITEQQAKTLLKIVTKGGGYVF